MKNKEQFSLILWDRLKKEGIHHTFETRDGDKVTQLTIFNCFDEYQVYGVTHESVQSWDINGFYGHSYRDLFIVWDEEQLFAEGFLNIYPNNVYNFHASKEIADFNADESRTACIPFKLTYKKGEGL